jgi:hypothetical protein
VHEVQLPECKTSPVAHPEHFSRLFEVQSAPVAAKVESEEQVHVLTIHAV